MVIWFFNPNFQRLQLQTFGSADTDSFLDWSKLLNGKMIRVTTQPILLHFNPMRHRPWMEDPDGS
ncbi:MAG: hypothetical protein IPH93_06280 [Saprospiraceae bacterium]|nr:hypothetical protein [Saprospiraceae bacterium]